MFPTNLASREGLKEESLIMTPASRERQERAFFTEKPIALVKV